MGLCLGTLREQNTEQASSLQPIEDVRDHTLRLAMCTLHGFIHGFELQIIKRKPIARSIDPTLVHF